MSTESSGATLGRDDAAPAASVPRDAIAPSGDLTGIATVVDRIEALLAAACADEREITDTIERIADIAFVLHERDVEPSLCDTLDASVRELVNAGALRRASVAQTRQAAELLRGLSQRITDLAVLLQVAPPPPHANDETLGEPLPGRFDREEAEDVRQGDIPHDGLFAAELLEDDEFAEAVAELAASLPSLVDPVELREPGRYGQRGEPAEPSLQDQDQLAAIAAEEALLAAEHLPAPHEERPTEYLSDEALATPEFTSAQPAHNKGSMLSAPSPRDSELVEETSGMALIEEGSLGEAPAGQPLAEAPLPTAPHSDSDETALEPVPSERAVVTLTEVASNSPAESEVPPEPPPPAASTATEDLASVPQDLPPENATAPEPMPTTAIGIHDQPAPSLTEMSSRPNDLAASGSAHDVAVRPSDSTETNAPLPDTMADATVATERQVISRAAAPSSDPHAEIVRGHAPSVDDGVAAPSTLPPQLAKLSQALLPEVLVDPKEDPGDLFEPLAEESEAPIESSAPPARRPPNDALAALRALSAEELLALFT